MGAAYIAGCDWGMDAGYGVVGEMDADGSHAPEQLPRLLAALENADLVLGRRWVAGGEAVNWPQTRKIISRGGNLYTRPALGIPPTDAATNTSRTMTQATRALRFAMTMRSGSVPTMGPRMARQSHVGAEAMNVLSWRDPLVPAMASSTRPSLASVPRTFAHSR